MLRLCGGSRNFLKRRMNRIVLQLLILFCMVVEMWSKCECGAGGLCKHYDPKIERYDISAVPCKCDVASKGIFVSKTSNCSDLVKYCPKHKKDCGKNGQCINGFGTLVCLCNNGWEGQHCDKPARGHHSSFVYIWYPVTKSTVWTPVICGQRIFPETELHYEFDDGRTYDTTMESCNEVQLPEVIMRCENNRNGSDCSDVLQALKNVTSMYYECSGFQLPHREDRSVWVKNQEGPIGQYHDVRVIIRDPNVVHFNVLYRVFLESTTFERQCPFRLQYSGCGNTTQTADVHTSSLPVVVKVSTISQGPVECGARFRRYKWYIGRIKQRGFPISVTNSSHDKDTVTFTPADLGFFYGRVLFHIVIAYSDYTDIALVIGMCYLNLVASDLKVVIFGAELGFPCGIDVMVDLKIEVPTDFLPEISWSCDSMLCGSPILNEGNLSFITNQKCGTEHLVQVNVTQSEIHRSAVANTSLKFNVENESLAITCVPDCEQVNPLNGVTVTATRRPVSTNFTWSDSHGIINATFCQEFLPSNVLTVPPNLLGFGSEYNFSVMSRAVIKFFKVKTIDKIHLLCQVQPASGRVHMDKFNFTCRLDMKLPLSFWIYEGQNEDLVAFSTNPNISSVTLTQTPVWVNVTDDRGYVTSTEVNVSLVQLTLSQEIETLKNIPSQMEQIWLVLHENDYTGVADEVNKITKWIRPEFPFSWKHTLMNFLYRIRICYYPNCLAKTADSIRRLSSEQVANGTQGVDDFLLKASSTLYTMSQSLEKIADQIPPFQASALLPLFTSIHDAACQVMNLVDPTLQHPNIGEDIRQIHFRKVEKANENTRMALSEMGLFITKHLANPTWPFELISGKFCSTRQKTTIVSNRPEYIDCVVACCGVKSYFQFQSLEAQKTNISAMVTRFNEKSFWWTTSKGILGEMTEVHLYRLVNGNWTRQTFKPVRSYFETEWEYDAVHGDLNQLLENDDGVKELQDNNIWEIAVPRGHGALSIDFSSSILNGAWTLIKLAARPQHDTLTSEHVLNQTHFMFKFYSDKVERVYIGVWSMKDSIGYYINISLIRCLTWSERFWKSELCQLYQTNENKIICDCAHLSLLNVETVFPEIKLMTAVNPSLYTTYNSYWYAFVILLFVLLFLLITFAIAIKLDSIRKFKKFVVILEDSYPGEDYPYLVGVFTSWRCLAGTSAHVAIRLIGRNFNSRVFVLNPSPGPMRLSTGQDSWFLLYTQRNLGSLEQIELWHDDEGIISDWHCSRVVVWELSTGQQFHFLPNLWLSHLILCLSGETTVLINREFVSGSGNYKFLILALIIEQFRERHTWASVVLLHPRSFLRHFDRAAILSVVVLTSMSTTMYFSTRNPSLVDDSSIGITSDDLPALSIITLVTSLVVLVPALLLDFSKYKAVNIYMPEFVEKNESMAILERWKRYIIYSAIKKPVMVSAIYELNYYTWLFYAVSTCIIASSFIFIANSGVILGRNKSFTWLTLSFLAILGEALVINPIYLLILAVMMARITKISPHDAVVIVNAVSALPFRNKTKRLAWALQHRVKPVYKPPLMDNMRTRVLKSVTYGIFNVSDVLLAFVLLLFIVFLVYLMEIKPNYYKNRQLVQHFAESETSGILDLDSVWNRSRYFDYLRRTLLPAMHRLTWYNGVPLNFETKLSTKDRSYCADYSTKLIGVPQLRQQRVSPNYSKTVDQLFQPYFTTAYGHLTLINEDTETYSPGWKSLDGDVYYKTYDYWPPELTKSGQIIGEQWSPYSGGGYVENLKPSLGSSFRDLIDLQVDNWLDNGTRTIFFSFNLYSAYVDQVAAMVIITDCLPSGVYKSRTMIDSIFLKHKKGTLVLMVTCIGFILAIQVTRAVYLAAKIGLEHSLRSVLGWVGIVALLSGICVIGVLTTKLLEFTAPLEEIEAAPRDAYTPLHWKFHGNSFNSFLTGVFAVSAAALAAVFVHKVFSIERMYRPSIAVFIDILVLQIIAATYFSYIVFYFGSIKVQNLFITLVVKETVSIEGLVGPSFITRSLTCLLIFFVIFLRFNINLLLPVYGDMVGFFSPISPLNEAFQTRLKSVRYLRMLSSDREVGSQDSQMSRH